MAEEATKEIELGVPETEVWLANELAEVCRDYCKEVSLEALNLAGFLTTSEWREARNVYSPPNIRKVLADLPLSLLLHHSQ